MMSKVQEGFRPTREELAALSGEDLVVEVVEAAVLQEERIEDVYRVRKIPGQTTEGPHGVKIANGDWVKHAIVQLARATGRLARAVEEVRRRREE